MNPERVVLDTSVLIRGTKPNGVVAAISVATMAELYFGVLVAAVDPDEQAVRVRLLGRVEATFEPIPVTAAIARHWGALAATVKARGGQPRKRQMDLLIAATAVQERVTLLTHNTQDFEIIRDLVKVRKP
ncbi:MAG: PIN domain-containing protein [Promicromonosporaceae bacterium]|nr:PIN domain-containing protein [Promicromonosporaceae bacterium]